MKSEDYTFNQFWKDLDNGLEIYYTYMDKRYLMYKLTKNCYKQELIDNNEKSPHPKMLILTLKRVRELFEYMSDFEYKIGIPGLEDK